MSCDNIYIAGRYNKYMRNLSQTPWFDANNSRIKESVQELIEDGLKQYIRCGNSVFSSSGREDVDVRMLGRGRPFSICIVEPCPSETYDNDTMIKVQEYINSNHKGKIKVRDLQIVSKASVSKFLKEGEDSKTKLYKALCCCSRVLTNEDIEKVAKLDGVNLEQKTPIRVLHRRTMSSRHRRIHGIKLTKEVNFDEFNLGPSYVYREDEKERIFVSELLTEAGTYIKEFVHGDFGRTTPTMSSILENCTADIIALDVMEVNLDWPPSIDPPDLDGT